MKIELNDNQVTILKQLLVRRWGEIDSDLKSFFYTLKYPVNEFLYNEEKKTALEIKDILDQITANEESEPKKYKTQK